MTDTDAALFYLEEALRLGYTDAGVALADPDLASVRNTQRFQAIVGRMFGRQSLQAEAFGFTEIYRVGPGHLRAFSPDGLRSITAGGFVLDELSGEVLADLGSP